MLITAMVLVSKIRVWVPTVFLSASMVPFASTWIAVGIPARLISQRLLIWIDNKIYTSYMRLTLFVFESLSNVNINFYGDIADTRRVPETALVISNHQSNVDWAVINMIAARQGPAGHEFGLRFVVKNVIHYVPLFGWYIFQHGYIYVRRFGAFIPDPLLRQFEHLQSLGQPYWLHIFPEGTRFSRKKRHLIEESQEFAKKAGIYVPHYTLLPRVGALALARNELKDTLEYIYDVTIAYDQTRLPNRLGAAPNMFEFVSSPHGPKGLHIHINRIPIDEVPLEKHELKQWLYKRFAAKDELLREFHETGAFPNLYEANAPKINFWKTAVPVLGYFTALILPFYSKTVRNIYLGTIAASPFLIAWLHVRKCV